MATATKICKVCGKEYPYCRTERRVAGVFRWQDVACCVEHGNQYFEKIAASRNEVVEPKAELETVVSVDDNIETDVETTAISDDDKVVEPTTFKSRKSRK